MAELDDEFDLELDEETLRQIEEEARRKVEAELSDEALLEEALPSEKASFEGIDDVEINAAMMREIEAEARRLLAAEGFDVDGADEAPATPEEPKVAAPVRQAAPAAAAKPPPLPVATLEEDDVPTATPETVLPSVPVKTSTARRAAIERARERAEAKARGRTRPSTKTGVKLKQTHTHRRAISDISAPPEPTSGKTMILIVAAAFVVMIGIAVVVGQMTRNDKPEPDPAVAVEGAAGVPTQTAEELRRAAWDEMQTEIKSIVRSGQTAENLEKSIALLEAFKADNPSYADLCDKDIKRYRSTLNFIKGGGG